MEEKIIRPTTKPEAIKGKLLKYQGTDYCEFMPQAQGEPQYEGISKTRHSQLKRSKGKAPKLVAHLTAQAESIDPYADMLDELGKLFPENKKNGLLKSQLLDSKVNPLDALAGIHLRFRPQSDDLNDLTSKSFLKLQVQPVINLVCRAKALDLTPDVSEVSKKKWASQKCTLAEFRNAGGFPNISGDGGGHTDPTDSTDNSGENTGGENNGGENNSGGSGGGSFDTGS